MDKLNENYEKFKTFCNDIDSNNEWVKYLQIISIELFINTIRSKSNMSPEEIKNNLIEVAKLDKDLVKLHEVRLMRFLEYFIEISKL
jgi:hypothetical protein